MTTELKKHQFGKVNGNSVKAVAIAAVLAGAGAVGSTNKAEAWGGRQYIPQMSGTAPSYFARGGFRGGFRGGNGVGRDMRYGFMAAGLAGDVLGLVQQARDTFQPQMYAPAYAQAAPAYAPAPYYGNYAPSYSYIPQMSGTAPSIYGAPQMSGTAPSIYGAPQMSGTAPSIYGAPQTSGTAPSIYGAPQTSGTAPSIYGAPQTSGTDPGAPNATIVVNGVPQTVIPQTSGTGYFPPGTAIYHVNVPQPIRPVVVYEGEGQTYGQTLVPGHVFLGNKPMPPSTQTYAPMPVPAQTHAQRPAPAVAAQGNREISEVQRQELKVGNQMKNDLVGIANNALVNAEKAKLMLLARERTEIKSAAGKVESYNNGSLQKVGLALDRGVQTTAAAATSSLPDWAVWVIAGALGLAGGVAGTFIRIRSKR